jgi:hypothetical protein
MFSGRSLDIREASMRGVTTIPHWASRVDAYPIGGEIDSGYHEAEGVGFIVY